MIIAAALGCAVCAAQDSVQKAAADAAAAISQAPQVEVPAPKPVYWTKSADLSLGFNQTSLTNWAAGGYNTATMSAGLDTKADYKKNLMAWNNRLQLNYAFLYSADKKGILQKSNDRMYLESKWALDMLANAKWKYTASFDFRSQFTDTPAKYVQDALTQKWSEEGIKSGFISPAYTNLALGLEWKPNNWLDVNFAPITGGFTIVNNELLRKSYGMELACADTDAAYLDALAADPNSVGAYYKGAKFQFGAQLKADLKFSINDNLKYETQAVFFTDYLDDPFVKTRVNWDNKITWKMAKYFSVAFNTWLIYDPNVLIKDDADIAQYPDGTQRIQFKEFISFNFSYSFKPKAK